MKKKIIALALITGLTMTTAASANWGKGQRGNGGNCGCPQAQGQMMGGQGFQQLDQATQDKIMQFREDTQAMHKEMVMKRAEKQALMSAATPDAQAVAKVTGEMFDLKTSLRQKAKLAGVDQYVGGGKMGRGGKGGQGRGQGCGQIGGGQQ